MTKMEMNPEALQKLAAGIRLVAMDVDGTLTDGSINIGSDGECFKRFNCRDGLGISTSVRHGLKIAIVTGRESRIIHIRAKEVGVDNDVLTGVRTRRRPWRPWPGGITWSSGKSLFWATTSMTCRP